MVLVKDRNSSIIGAHLYFFNGRSELKEIILLDELINAENTSCKLYIHNDQFCLVPSVLFDASVKSTYLNFITAANEELQEVFYEGVDSNNIQVVGAVEKEILALLDNPLPDMEVVHASSLFLSYMCQHKNDMLGQELFILAEQGHIYLAAFSGSDLQLFNRFPVQGDQDFLKYAFAVTHQLAFDRVHCRITLLGDLTAISIDIDVLKQYFKNIHIGEPRTNHSYSPGAESFKETNLLEAFWTP